MYTLVPKIKYLDRIIFCYLLKIMQIKQKNHLGLETRVPSRFIKTNEHGGEPLFMMSRDRLAEPAPSAVPGVAMTAIEQKKPPRSYNQGGFLKFSLLLDFLTLRLLIS